MRSYSYSQLQAAYKCNKYYKLLYIDKLVPESPRSADMVFGSSVHFALEQYLLHQSDIVESFHIYWRPEIDKVQYGRFDQKELENIAEILLTRFVRLHAKKIEIHQMEQRLYGTLNDIQKSSGYVNVPSVEGTPDILGSFEGVPSVIDFKTSGYRYPKEKVFLNEQMYLYAHLAKQNGYDAAQVVYMVFIKGSTPSIQVLKREITQEEMNKVLANITAQCKTLDMSESNGVWSYNSNSCQVGERKCDFFNHCWGTYTNKE